MRRRCAEKPLTVFSCCPTSPLKWSDVTSQNLVDCAAVWYPGGVHRHAALGLHGAGDAGGHAHPAHRRDPERRGHQPARRPGAPMLYGGSPAIFDMRYETTPMGAMETMMIDCAYSEIGKRLGMPTQAYIALSDAKLLDAQAGLETGIGRDPGGAVRHQQHLGPGMLDFESCQSLEKLVLDNEICGMALRLVRASSRGRTSPRCRASRNCCAKSTADRQAHAPPLRAEILPRPGDRPGQPGALAGGGRPNPRQRARRRGGAPGRRCRPVAAGRRCQAGVGRAHGDRGPPRRARPRCRRGPREAAARNGRPPRA